MEREQGNGSREVMADEYNPREILSQWYKNEKIYLDTFQKNDIHLGLGTFNVTQSLIDEFSVKNRGYEALPNSVIVESTYQTFSMIALTGKNMQGRFPFFKSGYSFFVNPTVAGDTLSIYVQIDDFTEEGLIGFAEVQNQDEVEIAYLVDIELYTLNETGIKKLFERR